jgi:hypothetical protein
MLNQNSADLGIPADSIGSKSALALAPPAPAAAPAPERLPAPAAPLALTHSAGPLAADAADEPAIVERAQNGA